MASYFILGLIEIFMLCFNEIKLKGDGARRWRWPGLKGTEHIFLPCQVAGKQDAQVTSHFCCQSPRPEEVEAATQEPQPRCIPGWPVPLPRLLRPPTGPGHLGAGAPLPVVIAQA